MDQVIPVVRTLARDRRGVTRVEYGLISCAATIACVVSVESVAKPLALTFAAIGKALAGIGV